MDEQTEDMNIDENIMRRVLALLDKCPQSEVPVSAAVVLNGEIVGEGVNLRETESDPTAHAEIVAIRNAAKRLKRWNLSDCELFVTLEPCVMCAGAIVYSRIKRVVFGASDVRFGACGSLMTLVNDQNLNHRADVKGGVLADECLAPIKAFFKARRKSGKD